MKNNVTVSVERNQFAHPAKLIVTVENLLVKPEEYAAQVFVSLVAETGPSQEHRFNLVQIGQKYRNNANSWSDWRGEYTIPPQPDQSWMLRVFVCNRRIPARECPPENMLLVLEQTVTIDAGVPVLMYHHITDSPQQEVAQHMDLYVSSERFDAQLQMLADAKITPLFASEIQAYKSHTQAVVLTFDDGVQDSYTAAFPGLKRYHTKATLFLVTKSIGRPGFLTPAQIGEMLASGLVEIGSHTKTHPDLRRYPGDDSELSESKSKLQDMFGQPIVSLAYPYGFFNEQTMQAAARAGYQFAFTTNPGRFVSQTDDALKINRLGVRYDHERKAFMELVSKLQW